MKKLCFLIVVAVILAGCAKSVTIKYAEPEARQLCEEDFFKRYHALIAKDETQEFEAIKSLSDCEKFLNSFWAKRDTDPTTPENEFKDEMKTRSQFIENEGLFTNTSAAGILFSSNEGFFGNLANVYMLHGMPDYIEVIKNGRTFVDLMVWVYFDETGRRHKYRFLFYNKNEVGSFVLYRPAFDLAFGLEEINKNPSFTDPAEIYYELEQRMGYIFLLSLVYFSDDHSMNVDKAMDPPKTASEIIEAEAPNIYGNLPEQEPEIQADNAFNSTIPATLIHKFEGEWLKISVEINKKDLDWFLKNNQMQAKIFVRIIVNKNLVTEENSRDFEITSSKEEIKKGEKITLEMSPINLAGENSAQINVYLKSNQKYNSWIEEIER